jgi:N-acetylglucosamine-6-sulfatase
VIVSARRVGVASLLALVLLAGWAPTLLAATRSDVATTPVAAISPPKQQLPNIVLVLTDDQRRDTLRRMPHVQELLVAKGTQFSNAMVPTALCCPSRATILTGLYAHHTLVYGNGDVGGPKLGGWPKFHSAGDEKRTIALALHRQGYRTGLIGKYLNFFGTYAPKGYTPPGWDTFSALMSPHGAYYNYRLSDQKKFYGSTAEDYSTDVFSARATKFIKSTKPDKPLFLYFAPFAPHLPYLPAPRYDGSWEGKLAPYVAPSLYQDPATQPAWLAARPQEDVGEVQRIRSQQQDTLMSVDDSVAALIAALRDTHRLHNTLFVFASDNGYLWGEHRMVGKDVPYAPATDIPLVVRWDGHVAAGKTDDRLALNVDLASTFAQAGGASMPTDGRSLLESSGRKGFVLEATDGYNGRPAYCGWRTKKWVFVRYATGEREMFYYGSNVNELNNLAEDPSFAAKRRHLEHEARLACSPEPPGYNW